MNNDAYAAALAEIEDGRLDKGAWARAFAESGGEESRAKALYIKARAESTNASLAWPDTQPPVEAEAQKHAEPENGNGKDFQANQPTEFYKAALGEKNSDYYIDKFRAFDEKGPGLHASWNWASFFFTAFWALYRKMYGWFFGWWFFGTVGTVLLKVPNTQIQQWVGIAYIASFLGFAVFANSVYHRKIKKRIASAQRSHTDVSRVSKRLTDGSGVHTWVAYISGAVPVLGITLAVALPAYFDYSKRQTIAATPVQAPAWQDNWNKGVIAPPTAPIQIDAFLGGIPRSSYESEVAAIRAKVELGEYSSTTVTLSNEAPHRLTLLDSGISEAIEKAQTTWTISGVIYSHIQNSSPFSLAVLGLMFHDGECDNGANFERFYAILLTPVAPSSNNVISFKPNSNFGGGRYCLIVQSVWR